MERTPGDMLTAYRERAGLSLVQLAKRLGMQYTNLSAMERNNRVIDLKMAKRLAKELNCHYTKFFE